MQNKFYRKEHEEIIRKERKEINLFVFFAFSFVDFAI